MLTQFRFSMLAGIMLACVPSMPAAAQDSAAPVQGPVVNAPAAPAPKGGTSSSSSFRLGTGISYSSGDYGEIESTEVFAIPVSLTYRTGALKVRVSVPFVAVRGPGSLLSTPEGRDSSGSGGGSGSDDGGNSGSNSGSGSSGSGSSGSGSSGSGSSGSGSSGGGIEVEDEDDNDVIDDDTVITGGGIGAVDNNRSGIGDVSIAMTYSLPLAEGTYFEPSARIKLPTASVAQRLGSGEFDVTLAADLVQELGRATVYIGGLRKFAGKPEGSTLRSVWGAGGGASLRLADGFTLGADYSWQQSSFVGRQASSEVTGWLYTRLTSDLGLTVHGGTGLNDNSANLFGGASVSLRF